MIDFILILLPLVAVGIATIIMIKALKKKNEKIKISEGDKASQNDGNKEEDHMAVGMSLGMCFGVAIGSAFTNTIGPYAITYGICFGMLVGMIIGMRIKK